MVKSKESLYKHHSHREAESDKFETNKIEE